MRPIDRHRLCSHHVGGRMGTRGLPLIGTFESDVISVLYEADDTCIEGIKLHTKDLSSTTVVLADCLSGTGGQRDFYIYGDRYLSSLLPLLRQFSQGYSYNGFGWDNGPDSFAVIETLSLETMTLDAVIAREAENVPPPNFLSLDTQGSELEILQGGTVTLDGHVVAVLTEVPLVATYDGQPTFQDISVYLDRHGFELASLSVQDAEGKSDRTPIGLRGNGFVTGADALFLKRPSYIRQHCIDPNLALMKLAFIAFLYGYYDLVHAVLSDLGAAPLDQCLASWPKGSSVDYLVFLKAYEELIHLYPPLFPIRFSDYINEKAGIERFNAGFEYAYEELRNKHLGDMTEDVFMEAMEIMKSDEFVGVEKLSLEVGFDDNAEDMRSRRQYMAKQTLAKLKL